MAKSREANRGAVLRRLRARLDRRTGGADAGADAQLRAQVDFYVRLRAALFANSGSTNVDAVDAVAVAALADDVTLPIDTLVHQAFPVSGAAKAPPSKKQRKSKAQDLDDDEPDDEEDAPEGEGAEAYELPLPAKCPAAIRRDIAKIIKQAAAQGKTPPRMAYPWKLKPLSKKGQLPFPAQKAYDEDKEQRDDYSDFEDDEDMFTVLPPPPHLDEVDDGEPDELDESLPDAGQDQGDDEDQEGPEDVEDPRSAAPKPSDDDKASSAGDEGAATSSKKKSTPAPASPKSQVSFQSFLGTLR
ncbi:hypothetical protein PF006_g23328 [Phytophthora fragariae]|uniref:Uncharacterized protein n=1 Tax=Phytophthora fragariae TaxID=53985 RepID=A0A6A3RKK8_9STRA|nr:hypothetical protein PF009_g18538 [Phytophthora fragariae]KAE9098612.1 hypothetical protein PF006_g23328 [Phytophthora fragariae]